MSGHSHPPLAEDRPDEPSKAHTVRCVIPTRVSSLSVAHRAVFLWGEDGSRRRVGPVAFARGSVAALWIARQVRGRCVAAKSEFVPHPEFHHAGAYQDPCQPTELRRSDDVASREERRVVERIGDLDADQDRLGLLEADRSVQG